MEKIIVVSSHRKKIFAVVAQLVEHRLPKPRVAGSSPVYRSKEYLVENELSMIMYRDKKMQKDGCSSAFFLAEIA